MHCMYYEPVPGQSRSVVQLVIKHGGIKSNDTVLHRVTVLHLATRIQRTMAVAISVTHIAPFDPHAEPSTTAERWKKWTRNFERMASASGCRDDQQKRDLLLHTAGESVQDIFDTFSDEAAGTSYVQAKSVLTAHFTPKNNVPYNRHMFHRESQLDGETVGKYVTRLRQLAVSCEFGDGIHPRPGNNNNLYCTHDHHGA